MMGVFANGLTGPLAHRPRATRRGLRDTNSCLNFGGSSIESNTNYVTESNTTHISKSNTNGHPTTGANHPSQKTRTEPESLTAIKAFIVVAPISVIAVTREKAYSRQLG